MKYGISILIPLSVSAFAGLIVGCSGGSSSPTIATATVSANKPSTAITAVSSAVAVAGTSMGSAGVSAAFVGAGGPVFHPMDITQDCSIHAEPLRAGVTVADADPDFPGKFMYCKLAYNTQDEESVQGAFAQVKAISCMLENAGLVFDGQAHSYTVTIDSTCWSATQLAQMGGGGSSMTLSVTGTSPAAFNTYYQRGVTMTVPNVGDMQLGTSVSTNKIEFMESEAISANSRYSSFVASLDYSTGDLRYELREDRYNDSADGSSSGGFSRHQRIYAKVATSGQSVTGLISVSAAQAETYNGSIQGGYGGRAVTASGDLVNGIKARFWSPAGASPSATSDLLIASNWTETTNTRCYTSSGANGGGCSSGIAIPTSSGADSFPFALIGASYTNSVTWADALGAWTFTTADPTQDVQ